MAIKIRKGSVTGSAHSVFGLNCQDAMATSQLQISGGNYYFGVVADGCSEGAKSEVGAQLAVAFIISRIEALIKEGVPILTIPDILYIQLLDYLKTVIDGYNRADQDYAKTVAFIRDHLLFTLIGFVVGPKDTIIFAIGDGVVVLNDFVDVRDEQNFPSYPAYHLIDPRYLRADRSTIQKRFSVYSAETANLHRLAVATDAWQSELLLLMNFLGASTPLNVQRQMNVVAKDKSRFRDDATVILVNID